MPASPYVTALRAHVGHDLLLLPGASAVVRDDAGRILLLRRGDDGKWSLPAGMIEPGEQPADAVLREIFEETGIRAEVERIGGVDSHEAVYPNGDRCRYLVVFFRCRAAGGRARPDGEESLEVGWFPPDALPPGLDQHTVRRIRTTAAPQAPAWFPAPAERPGDAPAADYVTTLRAHIGHDLLLLPGAGAIVYDDRDRLLLVRRGDNGKWSLPAGMIDPGEQPSDTVVREVYEETGVRIAIDSLGGVATHPVTYPNGDRCEYLHVWFRCRPVGGRARPDGHESLEVGWFAADELPQLDEWAKLRLTAKDGWYARPGADTHPGLSNPRAL
ncbi:NUDIX domain-containing protein [Paractinoplanes rhizophilus]|uniref:NUDIX domain-containing protein n=1 Tax=Paractinoplanes rhizophilus TaxID=1416877 RepID=A0ABW2HT75_9ACTN